MDLHENLRRVTEAAQREQDLPDFLAERLYRIIDNRHQFRQLERELAELAGMVELYDTYGQTGYMGMGVSNLILEKALARIEAAAVDP